MNPQRPLHILLMSVGSLVAQNVFSAFASRRQHLLISGINSVPEHPGNFLCDQCFWVPPLAEQAAFSERFGQLLLQLQPDLVLPGRDDDVVFLANWQEKHPQDRFRIPFGSADLARIHRDKLTSALWSREAGLPFVETLAFPGPVEDFLKRHPFPLIAKPRHGYGSQGVYILSSEQQLQELALSVQDYVLQPYLCPPEDLQQRLQTQEAAPLLYFQIPENSQYSVQGMISAQQEIQPVLISCNQMVIGRCEKARRVEIPELEQLYLDFTQGLGQQGWYGPVNLQCKPDPQGNWQIYEVNLRPTGTSSARLAMGYDELGLLVRSFCPQADFPLLESPLEPGTLYRIPRDFWLPDSWIDTLKSQGAWRSQALLQAGIEDTAAQ